MNLGSPVSPPAPRRPIGHLAGPGRSGGCGAQSSQQKGQGETKGAGKKGKAKLTETIDPGNSSYSGWSWEGYDRGWGGGDGEDDRVHSGADLFAETHEDGKT